MRCHLLLTIALLLTSFNGGDAGPMQAYRHFVRRDCQTGCVGCNNRAGCCCGGQVCVDNNRCEAGS
nr:TPA_inf: conotoxin precursor SF-mi2 [Conus ebraeus]